MRQIIIAILLIISFDVVAQDFPGYTYQSSPNYRHQFLGALQSAKGFINGCYTDTAQANSGYIEFHNGAQIWADRKLWLRDSIANKWVKLAFTSDISSVNIYNSDGIITGNRTLTGLNHTYGLNFDSVNYFKVRRNNVVRLDITSSISKLTSVAGDAYAYATTGEAGLWNDNSNMIVHNDDSIAFNSVGGVYRFRNLPTGAGVKALRVGSDGKFFIADTSAGGGTPTLTSTEIAYGSGGNTITSEPAFNYDDIDNILHILHLFSNDHIFLDFNSVSTPPSGYTNLYSDAHGRFFSKNDAGTVLELTNVAGGGTDNANVGSGYRWLKPGTQEIKTSFAGFGVIKDSTTNTDGITDKIDTTSDGVTSWVRTKYILDSLTAAGAFTSSINSRLYYSHYLTTTGGNTLDEVFYSQFSGTGATISRFSGTDIPDGWMFGEKLTTGTTGTGLVYYYTASTPGSGYGAISISSSKRYNFGQKIRFEDLSTVSETYSYYCGFIDDVTGFSSVVDGAGFRYAYTDSSGAWIAWTKSNSSLTEAATATTVAADTDYELEVSIFGGVAYFYINQTLVKTISTNLPSGSTRITNLGVFFRKSNGTTARLAYLEWMAYGKRNN